MGKKSKKSDRREGHCMVRGAVRGTRTNNISYGCEDDWMARGGKSQNEWFVCFSLPGPLTLVICSRHAHTQAYAYTHAYAQTYIYTHAITL